MKINIHDIVVPSRIRTEPGDLTTLKNSIAAVGLLNPIILTENYEILSGYRRYLACRELGWHEIDARIVELSNNKLQKLDLEYHENVGRLELSYEDRQKYLTAREQLLKPPQKIAGIWRWFLSLWQKIKRLFARKQKMDENYWV